MVTLRELEKQRINKIKSLNENEIDNYADILIAEMCNILDLDNIVDVTKSENDFADLIKKLDEIYDLTGNNYKAKADESYKAMLTIQLTKYIIKDNESKNDLLLLAVKDILYYYSNFNENTKLLYQLIMDFKELSAVAPDTVAAMKLKYIDSLKKSIIESKSFIDSYFDLLDKSFYSDEKIKNEIHECKVYIKTVNESTDESDKLLIKFGFNSIYSGFIDVYKNHSQIKNQYMKYKPFIENIIADSSNVFKRYSINFYDPDSNVSFDEYMKSQPKFNVDTGELLIP